MYILHVLMYIDFCVKDIFPSFMSNVYPFHSVSTCRFWFTKQF